MKTFITLITFIFFAVTVWAQESLLLPGQYLLISYTKDSATVQKCEITSTKDGTYVTFPAPLKFPEFAEKPHRIFIQHDRFVFTRGPEDYIQKQALDKVTLDVLTYRGSVSDGAINGSVTQSGFTSNTYKFVLYKE